jgi:hypothetical protein
MAAGYADFIAKIAHRHLFDLCFRTQYQTYLAILNGDGGLHYALQKNTQWFTDSAFLLEEIWPPRMAAIIGARRNSRVRTLWSNGDGLSTNCSESNLSHRGDCSGRVTQTIRQCARITTATFQLDPFRGSPPGRGCRSPFSKRSPPLVLTIAIDASRDTHRVGEPARLSCVHVTQQPKR